MDAFNIGAQPRCPDDLGTIMRDVSGAWECPACGGQLVLSSNVPQQQFKGPTAGGERRRNWLD